MKSVTHGRATKTQSWCTTESAKTWLDDYQEASSHNTLNGNGLDDLWDEDPDDKELYKNALINKFNSQRDFFLNCDLERINSILVDYGEKEYVNDDPDHLFSVLMSLFRIH